MPIHNSYIGQVFNELADLLEIEGANPFRVRAYRNAARVVTNWPQSLSDAWKRQHALPKLPGLGADLSLKVQEILSTGRLSVLREMQKKAPKDLLTLFRVPSLGPKRILLLKERLRINNLEDLKDAAKSGRIRELPGLGEKTEKTILAYLKHAEPQSQRIRLATAEQIAEPLLAYIKESPEVKQMTIAGSYRRGQETVGDLDILASSTRAAKVMDHFVRYEEVDKVHSHGITRATVLLRSGMQVDLRIVSDASFGAALHYFTGSKSHNIAVRTLGVKQGLKINEYGVFKGSRRIAGRTEEEVYRSVGLPYIEPELREMRGELDAAQELGYEYLAITDHSRHLTVARGLTPQRLRQQLRKIDQLNARFKDFRLLKSIEVDILEDGRLDLPDEVLAELDLTVCSIHFKFDLPERKQTERILRAMDNPYFNILAHPTGRLLDRRSPYAVNMERIMTSALQRGCFLEVNSQPDRMDLSDIYCKMAREIGVKVSISTDAHHRNDLHSLRFGLSQARRGWLEADDVLNTRPWSQLEPLLAR